MSDATPPAPAFEQGAKIAARYAKAATSIATIHAALAADMAPLQAAADKKLAPLIAKRDQAEVDAKAWWVIHGPKAQGKKKSAEIAGVVMGTRLSPAKVLFAHGDDKAAAAVLLKRRLTSLLQRVISPNKKAIATRLADEADKDEAERELGAMGFRLEQASTFYIEPATHTGRKA